MSTEERYEEERLSYRPAILALYRVLMNKIHFESGNIFYNKPGFEIYVQIAKLASDLRRFSL